VHTSRDRVLNRRRENRRGDSPRIHERDRPLERRVLEYSKPAEPADVCTRMDFSPFVRLRGRISREDIIGRSNRGGAVEGRWRKPPVPKGDGGRGGSRRARLIATLIRPSLGSETRSRYRRCRRAAADRRRNSYSGRRAT